MTAILNTPMQGRPHQWSKERHPLTAHLSRHPFIYTSLLLHALVLWSFFSLGAFQLEQMTQERNEQAVHVSMQKAEQSDMHRRVQNIEKIKTLMEQSLATKTTPEAANPVHEQSDRATPPTPEELLQQAKELLSAIQKIEQNIRISEMARVLQISEQEAAKKLSSEQAEDQIKAPQPAATVESLVQLEQQANEALVHRKQQLEGIESGLPIFGGIKNFIRETEELEDQADPGQGGSGQQNGGARGSDQTSNWLTTIRHADGFSPAPTITASALRSDSANSFGAGGRYANQVSINNWYIIGPFEGAGVASIEKKYPPEMGVDLDATYYGKYRQLLNWRYQHNNQTPIIPTLRGEYAVYYGYAEINMESARDLWVKIGTDDDSKVWLNDKLIWTRGNDGMPRHTLMPGDLKNGMHKLKLSEARRKLHFKQGRNTVMFKLYSGIDAMFFSLTLSAQ